MTTEIEKTKTGRLKKPAPVRKKAKDSRNGFTGIFGHSQQARVLSVLLSSNMALTAATIGLAIGSNWGKAQGILDRLSKHGIVRVAEKKKRGNTYELLDNDKVSAIRALYDVALPSSAEGDVVVDEVVAE